MCLFVCVCRAWDKQLLREQHFDIITQRPKKGHIHEVPYTQRLKPPSLVTANHAGYNIISTLSEDVHHWAPPGRRPPRVQVSVCARARVWGCILMYACECSVQVCVRARAPAGMRYCVSVIVLTSSELECLDACVCIHFHVCVNVLRCVHARMI